MKESERPRFVTAMVWLANKYPLGRDKQGVPLPRQLAQMELRDYFEALRDLPIEKIERGVAWHFSHSEYFPWLPASLRKSVEAAPPPPRVSLPAAAERKMLPETPPEVARSRLQAIFDTCNATFGTKLKA